MDNFKDLILQVLIILLPVFFYHMFLANKYNGKKTKEKSIVIVFLIAITMMLCISFPIFSDHELRYDLRYVVLMFGVLYGGGYTAGIILFLILLAYRFYFGGSGFYFTLFEGLLILPVIFLLYERFLQSNRAERTTIVVLISLFISLVFIGDHLLIIDKSINYFYLLIAFIMVLTSCVTVFMIENIRENYRLQLEVQNMEKLRVLGELTSSFAHEIRNPMQVNRGFLQLLYESSISEQFKGYVKICIEEMDRTNVIITDYLSFAKPEAVQVEPIEVGKEISTLVNILNSYALMSRVEIHMDLHSNELWIMANKQKLKQCLINIIKNGIEAMNHGGTLYISCIPHKSDVVISIIDQGVGMTDEQIKRLGTPFYSLKDKGTGLGLMVSYRIIESLHGKISVTSEKGKGAKFSIIIPQFPPQNSYDCIEKNRKV